MVQSKLLLEFPKIEHYFFDKNDPEINMEYSEIINNCISSDQTHSNNIIIIREKKKRYQNCDGLITNKKLFLGIKTADCMPILFYEPTINIVAAVHAGWKGLLNGIVDNAIMELEKNGARIRDIIAAIGPHIGSCCYKVLYERFIQFKKKFNYHIEKNHQGEWCLDLAGIAVGRMEKLGLRKNNIDVLKNYCTCCNLQYSSYRREGDTSSRIWSVIGILKQ